MPADPIPLPRRVAAGRTVAGFSVAGTGLAGGLTRRSALAGLAAASAVIAVAGCTPKQTTSAAQLIAGDALGPLYTQTFQLIAQYDRALADAPALVDLLGPLREEHRQHLIALASLIGLAVPTVSPGPRPSGIPLPPPHPTASGSPSAPNSSTTTSPTVSRPSSAATPPAVASGTTPPPPAGSGTRTGSTPAASALPSESPSTGLSTAAVKVQLSAAEKIAQANAVAACISGAAERVPIVAAIAACRATHVAALR